jgi:hypothetical protein
MAFGPDGQLYVSSFNGTYVINRYDVSTGAFLDTFVAAGAGGLTRPTGIFFTPDGDLLVSSYDAGQILEFRGPNNAGAEQPAGEFLGVFANTGVGSSPDFMTFGPDGNLYVGCPNHLSPTLSGGFIGRYDGSTGAFIDTFVPTGRGGLSDLRAVIFDRDGNLLAVDTGQDAVLRYQGPGGAAPGAFIDALVPSGLGGLSGPIGVTHGADGNLYVSSRDTDEVLRYGPTKFYVVNDGGAGRTYEYANGGPAVESYALGNGNSAPRGAASTAAGTTVWVLDANKKVYVYSPSGGLLGTWTAGGLPSKAQPEGIATDGTDVWLLDNRQDRVFRYAGAAGRRSGSQSAVGSFALASGNTNPKGIVTDGSHFWVVNDGSPDKVFKYTLTGALLGSWVIDVANASPTGLTIDPANVSDIWIVDNGTDRVYQYTAATSRTSGSQIAVGMFALAAGNTNPQDIADPPAPVDWFEDKFGPVRVAPAEPGVLVLPSAFAAAQRDLSRQVTTATVAAPTTKARPRLAAADEWVGLAQLSGLGKRKASMFTNWLAIPTIDE